jgi:hypothetical protein
MKYTHFVLLLAIAVVPLSHTTVCSGEAQLDAHFLVTAIHEIEQNALHDTRHLRPAVLASVNCYHVATYHQLEDCLLRTAWKSGTTEDEVVRRALTAGLSTLNDAYARIFSPYVLKSTTYMHGKVLVMNIGSFDAEMLATVQEALGRNEYDRIVINLWNSAGGNAYVAGDLADLFVEQGSLLHLVWASGRNDRMLAVPDYVRSESAQVPIVLVVSNQTASAAEIFSLTVPQLRSNVCVLGQRSYGKGVFQTVINDSIAFTAGYNVLPDGTPQTEVRVEPHIQYTTQEDALRAAICGDDCAPCS